MRFRTVKGMRDFPPEEMRKRQYVLDIIERVFKRWGYQPLDTPAVESFDLLAAKGGGGEEIKKEIYCFRDQGGRDLGLRFDLTVPLARFVSSNPNILKPFKRYQIGKVWRYDNPQAGRYREFVQTDIDIIGSRSPRADAEVIAVACDIFRELGFRNFLIRINNRKIMDFFMKDLDIRNSVEVFRVIDKMDKIGKTGVEVELKRIINSKKAKKILKFINESDVPDCEGKGELYSVIDEIEQLGYGKNIKVDLSLVRGLEYYTGTVFEVSSGKKWSLAGGGRYDKLIKILGGKDTPAVGISLGFERILEIMKEKEMFEIGEKTIFVAGVNNNVRKDVIKLASEIRKNGIPAELDVMERNLKKQLDYVSRRDIPVCVIVGPNELKQKKIIIKNMNTGKERAVFIKDIQKELMKELDSSK